MHLLLFLALVLFAGCGNPSQTPDASVTPDAGDAGMTSDAGLAVTWESHIEQLLFAKCSDCHALDAGLPQFAVHYDALLQPSTLCPGERVGDCVKWALEAQVPEGTRCRTVVRPFHREGWVCLTPSEIDQVVGWIDAGMVER